MRRFLPLLLCLLMLAGCAAPAPRGAASQIGDLQVYQVGLQTVHRGYVRLYFATPLSSGKEDLRQLSLPELTRAVMQISASHTDGIITLSLDDTAVGCKVFRWRPTDHAHRERVPLGEDHHFALRADGNAYVYEIVVSYRHGSISYLFLEMI